MACAMIKPAGSHNYLESAAKQAISSHATSNSQSEKQQFCTPKLCGTFSRIRATRLHTRFLTRAKHLRDLGRQDFRLRPVHVKPDFEIGKWAFANIYFIGYNIYIHFESSVLRLLFENLLFRLVYPIQTPLALVLAFVIWVYGIFRISGLLCVTNGLDPLEEQNIGTNQ
ncbi:metal transporter Nramp3-like [Dorcoceras hygrometricum]|uniref:Metal transporter Nramp3-like n=1 Tax=Dorcoceras hygrometricum TaxID=472368 RepID=A0A2Z7ABI9_9LAMI|nr:metal transporter Nramp3-like [Dorcoceras hygrometricum]